MDGKITTMREAISTFVKEGDTLFVSGMQHGDPSAAMHEIARQRIEHLTLVSALAPSTSYIIAEGLVDRLITGHYQMNLKTSYQLVRAREKSKYPVIEESSHHAIGLSLIAGQMNVPFLPTRALLASDIMRYNPGNLTEMRCPFTGQLLAAVRGLQPDVGIIHCQRADAEGNAQRWGTLGIDVEGIGASKKVIVTAEEIVHSDVIRRNPNLTIIPGFRASAVVHAPWGAYPAHLAGCYNLDRRFRAETSTPEAYENYLREYIHGVADWNEYLEKRKRLKGENYFEELRIKNPIYSDPIVTGY